MEDELEFENGRVPLYISPKKLMDKKLTNVTINFNEDKYDLNLKQIYLFYGRTYKSLYTIMLTNKYFTNLIDNYPNRIHLCDFNTGILYIYSKYVGKIFLNYDINDNYEEETLFEYHFVINTKCIIIPQQIIPQQIIMIIIESCDDNDIFDIEMMQDENITKPNYFVEKFMNDMIIFIPLHNEITKGTLKYINDIEFAKFSINGYTKISFDIKNIKTKLYDIFYNIYKIT
jgi:hypothetical protein